MTPSALLFLALRKLPRTKVENNALACTVQCCANICQVLQELCRSDPDFPLSVPILCELEGIILAKKTKHIYYVRVDFPSCLCHRYKVYGALNLVDEGSKNTLSKFLVSHTQVMHTTFLR